MSQPKIGDIVRFKESSEDSAVWLIESENAGRFYGRGFGCTFPDALSAPPDALHVLVPGEQLVLLLINPGATHNELVQRQSDLARGCRCPLVNDFNGERRIEPLVARFYCSSIIIELKGVQETV